MRQITVEELFKLLDDLKNTSLAAIVNAYELDTVYCIDQFDYEISEEKRGRILRLLSKNGERNYYDFHGIYLNLNEIAKISISEDTIYIYLQHQVVKLKFK
jgi:hypothetical protein